MHQEHLFFESFEDAARHVVQVLGGYKKIGHALRPGKSVTDAGRWLANALDSNRQEFLHPEDLMCLIKLGHDVGCHALLEYMNTTGGYTPPVPVSPEGERDELQKDFIASVKMQEQILKRLERLNEPTMRAVV